MHVSTQRARADNARTTWSTPSSTVRLQNKAVSPGLVDEHLLFHPKISNCLCRTVDTLRHLHQIAGPDVPLLRRRGGCLAAWKSELHVWLVAQPTSNEMA